MGFFTDLFKSGDESLKSRFFPLCKSGEMPYMKVIPKKRKVFCSESITKSKTLALDEITKISFEKTGAQGGMIHIFSGNATLLTMKSKSSPDKKYLHDCFEFIKSIQKGKEKI